MATIMAIGAHPDDIEIGAGATIARLLAEGHKVVGVDLTDGEETPCGNREIRACETAAASAILGLTERVCLDEPNRVLLDTVEARTKLAIQMRLHKPDLILTHAEQDAHPDHVAAFSITRGAALLSRIQKIDLPHGAWRPGRIFYYYSYHLRTVYRPEVILAVDEESFRRKIEAILAYESQFVVNPANNGIEEMVRSRMRDFGGMIRSPYGEPFGAEEPVGVRSLMDIV